MGLRKVGRIWWLDIRIEGRRYRRSLKTENRNEALYAYKEKKDELLAEYAGKKVRFSSFCEKYLSWAWSSKPKSALREQQRLRKIQEFFSGLEIVYLEDITPYHLEQLKAELKDKNLAKSTINRYLQILRGLFYKAIDWEVYSKLNPLKKVRFFKENSTIKPLSKEDIGKILKSAKDISERPKSPLQRVFYDVMLLALNTGMRKSEILNLKWKQTKGEEAMVEGKGGKRRVIPLNEAAMKAIIKQPKKTEYVFDLPNRHQADVFRFTILRIAKETGIKWHFHLLRHFFSSSLLEKGVDIVTIGSILGHSKISISLIYSHTDEKRKKKAVDLLEEKL